MMRDAQQDFDAAAFWASEQPLIDGADDLPIPLWPSSEARRVVEGRGLGIEERGAEWVDKDGDRWRFDCLNSVWQNNINRRGIHTGWYNVPTEDGKTSAAYAPYSEVFPAASSATPKPFSSKRFADKSPVPAAADTPHSAGAGRALDRNDLMDAARAAGAYADRVHPALRPHWMRLVDRLETAAIFTPVRPIN